MAAGTTAWTSEMISWRGTRTVAVAKAIRAYADAGDRSPRRRGHAAARRAHSGEEAGVPGGPRGRAACGLRACWSGAASSLDAVVAAVRVLEDDPLFNAGRGAVYAANGTIELDASLMDGATLRAGAVAGVRHVRSPIELARRVLEHSPHVMLAGQGAEEFALEQGMAPVPNSFFATDHRRLELERAPARRAGRPGIADRDRRRGRARRARQSRGGHLDRRADGQALGTCRRFTDHRRGNVRGERCVRRVCNRSRGVLHPPGRRARDRRADTLPGSRRRRGDGHGAAAGR